MISELQGQVPQGLQAGDSDCCFYIASDGGKNLKIGVTKNPVCRRKGLQTGNPEAITYHLQVWFDSREEARVVESWMKSLLSPWLAPGGDDWYKPPTDIFWWLTHQINKWTLPRLFMVASLFNYQPDEDDIEGLAYALMGYAAALEANGREQCRCRQQPRAPINYKGAA